MKNRKSALALVAAFAAAIALSSCDGATADKNGAVLTYTDANGNVVSYTASELLGNYQEKGSSVSTEFDKVYEVLIRNYYDTSEMATTKATLETKAKLSVENNKQTARQNASSNGTSYEEEMSKIFSNNGVKNIDELYEKLLYDLEKENYSTNFSNDNRAAMRDGSAEGLLSDNYLFSADENYGRESKGWIKEKMPYAIRHILIKVGAASGEFTQAELTEGTGTEAGDATKLASVIMRLAGCTPDSTGTTVANTRDTFGSIAKNFSDDGSASTFGYMSDPMTKDTSYVNEFKLGIYAYESLYNQKNKATAYGSENVVSLTPGLEEDATSQDDVDSTQTLDDSGTTINEFFKTGEANEDGTSGIGQIPYGAAVALYKAAKITNYNGTPVNYGDATFYPRNILFNKYFNKHNVCVITPNEIAYNDNSIDAESKDGKRSDAYASLPGFQTDTSDVLPGINGTDVNDNVLTNSEGEIVLVVRAGSSDYQGVHFITISRSALDYYGNGTDTADGDIATLSEFYTYSKPGDNDYPQKSSGGDKTTFVNSYIQENGDYTQAANKIISAIDGYNDALNTYMFTDLLKDSSLQFVDSDMEKRIQNYSKTLRQSNYDSSFKSWTEAWKTYAEMLELQNELRSDEFSFQSEGGDYVGDADAKDHMISEVCAIGYSKDKSNDPNWQPGGKCYHAQ